MGFDRLTSDEIKALKSKWAETQDECVKAADALRTAQYELSQLAGRPDEDPAGWINDVADARDKVKYAEQDLQRARERGEERFDKLIAERWG